MSARANAGNEAVLRDEASAFFDAFVGAFSSFDGREIARRYAPCYLSVRTDGTVDCFGSPTEIAAYFQTVLDRYRDRGCRSCRYDQLDVVPVGGGCALATVTWALCLESGALLTSWRESYHLVRTADGFRIFASVDHAPV